MAAAYGVGVTAGAALLLYTGQGFLRAAGFLLGLALAALAAGVWNASLLPGRVTIGRWLLVILGWCLAAAFAAFWAARQELRDSTYGGAFAVLFILAEPAYLSGGLIAALSGARLDRSSPAALSLAGGAAGVLAASTLLIPRLDAPYVLLGVAAVLGLLATAHALAGAGTMAQEEIVELNDRVALITGVGSDGQLGYVVAQRLLDAGARVLISDRSGRATELARRLGAEDRVAAHAADLTDDDAVAALVAAARERFGRLDVLVNVAGGLTVTGPVAETEPEQWRKEIERNADTAFRLCRAALPLLRHTRGCIVNFTSPAGVRAVKNLAAYSAAKAAIVALTRALAIEERDNGVRVNAIAPGMIDTEQNRASAEHPDRVRWVTREQVADVVLFLASESGSGVNGEVVQVLADGVS